MYLLNQDEFSVSELMIVIRIVWERAIRKLSANRHFSGTCFVLEDLSTNGNVRRCADDKDYVLTYLAPVRLSNREPHRREEVCIFLFAITNNLVIH